MSIHYRPTICEIDLNALRHNGRELKKRLLPGMELAAIVKANAYGHGAVACARVLGALGIKHLGVATVEEGIELREAGLQGTILLLGGMFDCVEEVAQYRFKPVLHHLEDVKRLGSLLDRMNQDLPVHIKLDTGMGRLGFLPSQIEELLPVLKKSSHIKVEGVLTHLARADEENAEPTERQFVLFDRLRKIFAEKGINATFYHIANSAALIENRLEGFQWARPGLALYGAYPHPRLKDKIDLKPVMSLKTKIISLKKFPEGSPISYGATFVTSRDSVIAVLPIGYADGYPRSLSSKAQVLVRGKRAPVVGRVCMDLTMIDVTDIPDVALNDEVVLMGAQENEKITAEEIASWAGTIAYEIFCGISARVPRVCVGS